MCGIAGICHFGRRHDVTPAFLLEMVSALGHRGPDQTGLYVDDHVGLGQVRLSIIDLAHGEQPIHNEDQTLWIVYNGEVFNYVELREQLQRQGHRFTTGTDTEVVLHLFEEKGPECLHELNGQFAFALWDSRKRELFLARDRVGILPLHYAVCQGSILFGSEIKALFRTGLVTPRIDPIALDQIFTFWTTLSPRTAFEGIQELPPGSYMTVTDSGVTVRPYWRIPLVHREQWWIESPTTLAEQVGQLLVDAVRIRLRADVPVGCYLSGGLDSSAITRLASKQIGRQVQTFGIRFEQPEYDEGSYQEEMVAFLGCQHTSQYIDNGAIGVALEDVLWYGEKPILRTAPVPLYRLSERVRECGLKVVLTGEGADEVFGGYHIFLEAKLRRFWARSPESGNRDRLMEQLYPYVFKTALMREMARSFFARGADQGHDPLFSHWIRWTNTSRIKAFFSDDLKAAIGEYDGLDELRRGLPEEFDGADTLSRAQYLEMQVFLSNYLLSSQGDRMAMAHSVEIRPPFLDHRVIEFMARVPSRWKMLGLREKYLLKKVFHGQLPERVTERPKHPYRAPVKQGLWKQGWAECVRERLAVKDLSEAGLFAPGKVARLLSKLENTDQPSEADSMALIGILSSQIIHHQFVMNPNGRRPDCAAANVVIDRRRCQHG